MKKIRRVKLISLLFAIFTSVAFPVSLVGLILGAVNKIYFLMIIGIVVMAGSFLALPFVWLAFGSLVTKNRVCYQILVNGVRDLDRLSTILSKPVNEINYIINKLIAKGYLPHNVMEVDTIVNTEEELKFSLSKNKCPNCGAPLKKKRGVKVCEHCLSEFDL